MILLLSKIFIEHFVLMSWMFTNAVENIYIYIYIYIYNMIKYDDPTVFIIILVIIFPKKFIFHK